ncbi:hypothetical protein ACLBW0_16465 [Enterobacteriaceae bacterium C34A]
MRVIDKILSDCGKYNAPDVGFQTINNPTWDSLLLPLQAAKYLHSFQVNTLIGLLLEFAREGG